MLLCGTENIKDVIAFPKIQSASDLMNDCPSEVEESALDLLGIKVVNKENDVKKSVISKAKGKLRKEFNEACFYISGENKDAEFYLVRKTNKTGSELARYIYEEVQAGNAITLQFKWLYSDTYISVMQSLENVPDGEYYLAFKGTSDNSHPMVESIKFMKG